MISVILLVALLSIGAYYTVLGGSANDVSRTDLIAFEAFLIQLNRRIGKRDPAGEAKVVCGKKVPVRVREVCNGPCTPGSEANIASICCEKKCTDDYIKGACCPETL